MSLIFFRFLTVVCQPKNHYFVICDFRSGARQGKIWKKIMDVFLKIVNRLKKDLALYRHTVKSYNSHFIEILQAKYFDSTGGTL